MLAHVRINIYQETSAPASCVFFGSSIQSQQLNCCIGALRIAWSYWQRLFSFVWSTMHSVDFFCAEATLASRHVMPNALLWPLLLAPRSLLVWRLFLFTGTLRGLFSVETFSLSMETFPLYGDFTGTLLYGEFFSLYVETFPLYGDSSLWRLFLSLWRLFLFTGTLRGLFSMETFSLSMETFPLYGDFTGTLLYGDFSSLYGDFSSLRGLYGDFTGTLLYGDFFSLYGDFSSLRWLYGDFTGTGTLLYGDFFSLYGDFSSLRGLYGDFTGTLLYGDFFSLYGDFSSLRGLYGDFTGTLLYGDFSSLPSPTF